MKAMRSVVVMARPAVAGEVKTRLAEAFGERLALAVYRLMLRRTLRRVARGPWSTVVAVAPSAGQRRRHRFRGFATMAQSGSDLGERMSNAFAAMPPGPVVVVGTDIPGLRRQHISRAFRALERHEAVFGPALDGGYWLVGLAPRLRDAGIFSPVRWSTRHALADTLENIPTACATALIGTLGDVDTAQDVERWLRGLHPR
ncbi:MAG: TIGR04282 family arsenosugar biosynthesis glycosyltransferase [bacterium]|nr:TIGR04282 family arsenosugar biosynthesis glycosyltransferase [bacterium]